jgi:hypothetical protein
MEEFAKLSASALGGKSESGRVVFCLVPSWCTAVTQKLILPSCCFMDYIFYLFVFVPQPPRTLESSDLLNISCVVFVPIVFGRSVPCLCVSIIGMSYVGSDSCSQPHTW